MMTQAQLATASLNDIVFDGRNKEYGAYELRALYERHVRQALAWASVVLLLLLLYPVVTRLLADPITTTPIHTHGDLIPMDIPLDPKAITPPPVAPPVTPPPPPTQARPTTVRYTQFTVAKNPAEATDDVPNQADLVDTQVGTITFSGGENNTLPSELPIGDGNVAVNDAVAAPTIYISVEQFPEVMRGGGLASIVAAIQKAARYPAIDLRNGVEGKMFASFIVSSTGEIIEAKIVRGLSPTLDAETLRAIGTLPKLIPARQNGQAVNVSFTVPISYKIQ